MTDIMTHNEADNLLPRRFVRLYPDRVSRVVIIKDTKSGRRTEVRVMDYAGFVRAMRDLFG